MLSEEDACNVPFHSMGIKATTSLPLVSGNMYSEIPSPFESLTTLDPKSSNALVAVQ